MLHAMLWTFGGFCDGVSKSSEGLLAMRARVGRGSAIPFFSRIAKFTYATAIFEMATIPSATSLLNYAACSRAYPPPIPPLPDPRFWCSVACPSRMFDALDNRHPAT